MRFLTAFRSQGNGIRLCLVACVIYCHVYPTRFSKDLHKQIDFRPQLLKVEDKWFIHKNLFLKPCLASKLFPKQLVWTPLHAGSSAHQPWDAPGASTEMALGKHLWCEASKERLKGHSPISMFLCQTHQQCSCA